MIRKVCMSMIVLAVLAPCLLAQSVDEIIAKNVQARGGADKLKRVKSIKSTATMSMGPGIEAPGVLIQKRPALARLEFTVQGLTAVQAYDGKNGWQIMPFMGKKDPELMSADGQCCLAFSPRLNEWQGMRRVDLEVIDFQPGGQARFD